MLPPAKRQKFDRPSSPLDEDIEVEIVTKDCKPVDTRVLRYTEMQRLVQAGLLTQRHCQQPGVKVTVDVLCSDCRADCEYSAEINSDTVEQMRTLLWKNTVELPDSYTAENAFIVDPEERQKGKIRLLAHLCIVNFLNPKSVYSASRTMLDTLCNSYSHVSPLRHCELMRDMSFQCRNRCVAEMEETMLPLKCSMRLLAEYMRNELYAIHMLPLLNYADDTLRVALEEAKADQPYSRYSWIAFMELFHYSFVVDAISASNQEGVSLWEVFDTIRSHPLPQIYSVDTPFRLTYAAVSNQIRARMEVVWDLSDAPPESQLFSNVRFQAAGSVFHKEVDALVHMNIYSHIRSKHYTFPNIPSTRPYQIASRLAIAHFTDQLTGAVKLGFTDQDTRAIKDFIAVVFTVLSTSNVKEWKSELERAYQLRADITDDARICSYLIICDLIANEADRGADDAWSQQRKKTSQENVESWEELITNMDRSSMYEFMLELFHDRLYSPWMLVLITMILQNPGKKSAGDILRHVRLKDNEFGNTFWATEQMDTFPSTILHRWVESFAVTRQVVLQILEEEEAERVLKETQDAFGASFKAEMATQPILHCVLDEDESSVEVIRAIDNDLSLVVSPMSTMSVDYRSSFLPYERVSDEDLRRVRHLCWSSNRVIANTRNKTSISSDEYIVDSMVDRLWYRKADENDNLLKRLVASKHIQSLCLLGFMTTLNEFFLTQNNKGALTSLSWYATLSNTYNFDVGQWVSTAAICEHVSENCARDLSAVISSTQLRHLCLAYPLSPDQLQLREGALSDVERLEINTGRYSGVGSAWIDYIRTNCKKLAHLKLWASGEDAHEWSNDVQARLAEPFGQKLQSLVLAFRWSEFIIDKHNCKQRRDNCNQRVKFWHKLRDNSNSSTLVELLTKWAIRSVIVLQGGDLHTDLGGGVHTSGTMSKHTKVVIGCVDVHAVADVAIICRLRSSAREPLLYDDSLSPFISCDARDAKTFGHRGKGRNVIVPVADVQRTVRDRADLEKFVLPEQIIEFES